MPSARRSKRPSVVEFQLDDVLGYQLARASIRTDSVFFRVAGAPLNLRPVEYTILSLILENPELSAARLAEMLSVTAPNITAWLAKLEKRELLHRVTSTIDRRAQVLSLTAAGAELATQATQRIVEAEKLAFGNLSDDELKQLNALLGKVATLPDGG